MKTAIIAYRSKKGTTKKLANEIGRILSLHSIKSEIKAVEDFQNHDLSSFDLVFLGCWTSGAMIFAQHPDKTWKDFAKSLVLPENGKIVLFATYLLATGSMFSKMRENLPHTGQSAVQAEIKSRNGSLSSKNIQVINQLIT